jgi:hypothetical protein
MKEKLCVPPLFFVRHDDHAACGEHAADAVADRDLGAGDLRGGGAAHLAQLSRSGGAANLANRCAVEARTDGPRRVRRRRS